jgi:hypothetical protein
MDVASLRITIGSTGSPINPAPGEPFRWADYLTLWNEVTAMALTLRISDIVKESKTNQEKLLTIILQNMKKFKCRRAYSEYAPHLDFANPASRQAISSALYSLWHYCVQEEIPLLNMLVVLKEKGLPSTGIESWYEKKFNTLQRYDEYCDLHAKLAEFVLQNDIVVLT